MIDVSGGDKIPRKGGPGIMRSDLLLINKIDLAPYVGASLEVMDRDARKMRHSRPFLFTNMKDETGLDKVIQWLEGALNGALSNMSADRGANAYDLEGDQGHGHSHSHNGHTHSH